MKGGTFADLFQLGSAYAGFAPHAPPTWVAKGERRGFRECRQSALKGESALNKLASSPFMRDPDSIF